MAAGDQYRAAKSSFYGTAAQVRDLLARLMSGENPDGSAYTPPLLNQVAGGSGGTVSDATTTTKGVVRLAGDLGGTAAAPTVPGLAGKAATTHTHAQSDVTGLTAALAAKQATLTSTSDVPGLATALTAKQDAATAATDTELAAAVSTLNSAIALKQDAATAATDTEIASAITTHEADTSAVHGITDTYHLIQVVQWTGSAYETRPTNVRTVIFIGPNDPSTAALDGRDMWVPTS